MLSTSSQSCSSAVSEAWSGVGSGLGGFEEGGDAHPPGQAQALLNGGAVDGFGAEVGSVGDDAAGSATGGCGE